MRVKKHPFSLCCIIPRSHMGVYRAILPTEKMDYVKPDSSISQFEERPDRLDKAGWGIVKYPCFCEGPHIGTQEQNTYMCVKYLRGSNIRRCMFSISIPSMLLENKRNVTLCMYWQGKKSSKWLCNNFVKCFSTIELRCADTIDLFIICFLFCFSVCLLFILKASFSNWESTHNDFSLANLSKWSTWSSIIGLYDIFLTRKQIQSQYRRAIVSVC